MSVSQNQHVSDTHTKMLLTNRNTSVFVSDYLKKQKKSTSLFKHSLDKWALHNNVCKVLY